MSVSLSLVISGMGDAVFKPITVGLPASLASARIVLKLIKLLNAVCGFGISTNQNIKTLRSVIYQYAKKHTKSRSED